MASEERERGNDEEQRQRPVQFRGLSTHYVAGENIRVSFRYPASSFRPHSQDKVKLYARASKDKSVSSAVVGDCSKHRLCDGGLYKTGSVVISTAELSGCPQRQCVLLYGSERLRKVLGKSDPFFICPREDYPSIQILTAEDRVFIDKLRSHSPIREDDELSFTRVPSGGWEVLDDDEEEEEGSSGSESWSDVGKGPDKSGDPPPCSELLSAVAREELEEIPPTEPEATPPSDPSENGGGEDKEKVLKNEHQELGVKVHGLQERLEGVGRERDKLLVRVSDMSERLSRVQCEKSELKHKNKKLAEERQTLRDRNHHLVKENMLLTQHCRKQVGQMSHYEARLKRISSENHQLQQQLQLQLRSGGGKSGGDTGGKRSTGLKKPVIDVYVRDREKVRGGEGVRVGRVVKGEDSLSEGHIESLMDQLKGGQRSFQCPVCKKVLHSHETEFSVQLHVEHCLNHL